jgi:CDP-glucose 4,6-dehydratase
MEDLGMSFSIYKGKRVLVTGHTGFKGSWLVTWLELLSAEVSGYGLDPDGISLYGILQPSLTRDERGDVRDLDRLRKVLEEVQPDIVFHLAAQALVGTSYENPLDTVTSNVVGTANLLECVRALPYDCHCVVVTSDKCYLNREWEYAYRENDHLGGRDVYSASKAAAEIITAAWNASFFQSRGGVATARGGNVIGGGDFTKGRLFPDCVASLAEDKSIEVRNPASIRPWQHVLDCLGGYLRLGEWLLDGSFRGASERSFNFGPVAESRRSVAELVEQILGLWPGQWIDRSDPLAPHEAGRLAVSIDRAGAVLGWTPTWEFLDSVRETVGWYRLFYSGGSNEELREETIAQIRRYVSACGDARP